jgi:hypothetical protein
VKIKLEFDNGPKGPNLPDFSESQFESIAKACDGQKARCIAEAMSDVLGMLRAVSVREIVVRMVKLLHPDEQQAIATDILAQWGEDIVNSVGKTIESESANKDHGRP